MIKNQVTLISPLEYAHSSMKILELIAELLVQDDDGIITAGTIVSGNIKKMVVMKHTANGSQNPNFHHEE